MIDAARRKCVLRGAAAQLLGCDAPEILVEGPAGTGKSLGILKKIHMLCWRHEKMRALICRATRKSMTESILKTWEEAVLGDNHPAYSGTAGRANRHCYDFPNKATVVVGGLDNPDKLFSTEWDIVYVAEANEITLDDWEKLGRGMRNFMMPYHQRIADVNPVNPAHWLNATATPASDVLRAIKTRAEWNALQRWHEAQSGDRMRRLISRFQDNPAYWDFEKWDWTMHGQQYVLRTLAKFTGHRRARLFEGRWVAAEGTVFQEFFEPTNVVRRFTPPASWPVWICIDPGYDHPCAVTWNTMAPNGWLITFDELYVRETAIPEVARLIHEKNGSRVPTRYLLDPRHGYKRTQESPVTIDEQYRKEGVNCEGWPAVQGSAHDASVAYHRKRIIAGEYKVTDNCVYTIQEHQTWAHKRTSSGDLPQGDDAYEDKNNHTIDGIMGLERTYPEHAPGQIRIGPQAA